MLNYKSQGARSAKRRASIATAAFAVMLAATPLTATPAFAIDNLNDCTSGVTKLVQDLLKANVSSEQVNFVYEAINQAEEACANGDFTAAEAAMELGNQRLKDATAG